MAQAKTGGRSQRGGSARKPTGGAAAAETGQAAGDLSELQRRYVSARAEYATTVREALEQLSSASADAQSELIGAVGGLSSELRDGGEAAARRYPERLQSALANPEHATRVGEAAQAYVDALRELASAQGDAEKSARDAYHEYVSGVQSGEAEDEVRSRGERARQAQLDALTASSPSGDLHSKVLDAQRTYEQVVRETQAAVLEQVTEAMREFGGIGQRLADEKQIPTRYEEAVRRYQSRVADLVLGTQRALLEAQIRALGELQSGWTTAAAAAGSGSTSNGGTAPA
jgi:hypothetical protein